jgi:hypothetical protein
MPPLVIGVVKTIVANDGELLFGKGKAIFIPNLPIMKKIIKF